MRDAVLCTCGAKARQTGTLLRTRWFACTAATCGRRFAVHPTSSKNRKARR